MKRLHQHPDIGRSAAFTLIEMIGVLAIMAILASVLVPNVLRSMDRAAVRAEAETLKALGEQVKLYLRINGTMPSSVAPVTNIPATPSDLGNLENVPSWSRDIGALSDIAVYDIAVNKRNMRRVYLVDPASTPLQTPRVMILSSMRTGLPIPVVTAAQFQSVWQTADKTVPPGWATWTAVSGSGEQLLIERVNLQPIYQTELVNVTLKNSGQSLVRCSYILPSRPTVTVTQDVPVSPPGQPILLKLPAGVRVDLYDTSNRLNYAYVARDPGLALEFNGTNWIPK